MQNTDTGTVEISISVDNIARYNKRLQKALSEHFGQKIALNVASNLLAKTFGKSNEFELQKTLQQSAAKESRTPSALKSSNKIPSAQEVHDYILRYLKSGKKSNIVFADYVFLSTSNEIFYLKIGVWSEDHKKIYTIGLTLGHPNEKINTGELNLTEMDSEFLQNVVNYCGMDDADSMFTKMKNYLNIKQDIDRTSFFALYRAKGLDYIKGDLLEKEEFIVMSEKAFKQEIKGKNLVDGFSIKINTDGVYFAESLESAFSVAESDEVIVKVIKVLKTGECYTRFWINPYKFEVIFASSDIEKMKFNSSGYLLGSLPEVEGMLDAYSNSVEPYYLNKVGASKYFDKYQIVLKTIKESI